MKNKISIKSLREKYLKNIGRDKLLIIVAAGILLIVISFPTKKPEETSAALPENTSNISSNADTLDYEEYLEEKIEKLLTKVEGVGKVDIMVTLKGTSEKILVSQDDISENTIKETDSDGGVRETVQKSKTQSYLYSENAGEPYVAMEIKPEVEGVLIIAQGGGDIKIAANVTKAIEALLSVPVHKIQVLKMKN